MPIHELYNFQGKTALITGASGGLGEQFARALSQAGCRVLITARRENKLQNLAKELKDALAVQLDVSDLASVRKAFALFEEKQERIDICINNAGIARYTPLFEEDPNQYFEEQIQTNLMGVWYVTRAVANHMKNHKIEGSIINIGSVNGENIPAPEGTGYSVSKAAVSHLTRTLVGELALFKIRINCISPGWFRTPMNGPNVDDLIPKIPYGDIPNPQEMDGLILYLASNKASRYVSGSTFTIDGGISWGGMRWPG